VKDLVDKGKLNNMQLRTVRITKSLRMILLISMTKSRKSMILEKEKKKNSKKKRAQ